MVIITGSTPLCYGVYGCLSFYGAYGCPYPARQPVHRQWPKLHTRMPHLAFWWLFLGLFVLAIKTQRPPEKRYFCVYVIATRASLWSTIAPQTLARWESHAAPNSMHRKGPRHRGFRIRKSVVYAKKCNARPWWNLISCMRALVVVMDVMLCRDMSN